MKEKNKKAKKEEYKEQYYTSSRGSYDQDATLKDLVYNLKELSSELREKENKEAIDQVLSFDSSYPTTKEKSLFAKESSKLSEINLDFKKSLNKIATTFSKAFANEKYFDQANQQIQEILIENFFQTARALAVAVEARDPYTGGHSDRVFQIASGLGKMCNISTTEQLYINGGALLHDVGKIAIRDSILLKPGPLTESEYKEMQLHTIMGAQIVKRLNCLSGCIDVVLLHHERMDGYGYPYGIKGKEIPLIARITSIADAYDAMTTNRIYRKALTHEMALEEVLRNSGTQFDPEIVRIFVKWWEETFEKKPSKSKELYKHTSNEIYIKTSLT